MTDFRNTKRYRMGVGLGLALLVAGTFASAEEVYTATLTAARGLGRKTAELTVTITSRTSEEDAAKLQKILAEQGSAIHMRFVMVHPLHFRRIEENYRPGAALFRNRVWIYHVRHAS